MVDSWSDLTPPLVILEATGSATLTTLIMSICRFDDGQHVDRFQLWGETFIWSSYQQKTNHSGELVLHGIRAGFAELASDEAPLGLLLFRVWTRIMAARRT